MDKNLLDFGFKKNGLYSYSNDIFHVVIYFDGLTITKTTQDGDVTLYDGMCPKSGREEIELIEQYTKLKIINNGVESLLDSTKSDRIFSNTSLYISNLIISYFKYNNVSEEEVCKKLSVDKETLKGYLKGTYDFKLSEITKISILVGKSITIK